MKKRAARGEFPEEPFGGGETPYLAPEGVEPGGPLGPETNVRAADPVSEDAAELDRLRAREDELLRALAELQNVLRRRKQDVEAAYQGAQESLIRELLPVLDDFERALEAMEGNVDEAIRAGIALVHDRLVRILAAQGLEPIRPKGQPFDPTLHDAIAEEPTAHVGPGTVLQVVQAGYRLRGRVLRHAKVIVAGPADRGARAAGVGSAP